MPERPPILARGVIWHERQPEQLYEIEMPNGHRALAVVPKEGPLPPAGAEPVGMTVTVAFSPFEMSRSRVVSWDSA